MGRRVKYAPAPDVCRAVRIIVSGLEEFGYIDLSRVHCVRSWGSRSLAIARIYGLPRAWIVALGVNPGYVIEVISERFDPLPGREKVAVLIHELLHIPRSFSGGLRPHGKLVNNRRVTSLLRLLGERGLLGEAIQAFRPLSE